MTDSVDHLNNEIIRLGKALEILAQTLRIQRVTLEHVAGERDDLRHELDVASAKITCLMTALQNIRDDEDEDDDNIIPFTPVLGKKSQLH